MKPHKRGKGLSIEFAINIFVVALAYCMTISVEYRHSRDISLTLLLRGGLRILVRQSGAVPLPSWFANIVRNSHSLQSALPAGVSSVVSPERDHLLALETNNAQAHCSRPTGRGGCHHQTPSHQRRRARRRGR